MKNVCLYSNVQYITLTLRCEARRRWSFITHLQPRPISFATVVGAGVAQPIIDWNQLLLPVEDDNTVLSVCNLCMYVCMHLLRCLPYSGRWC
jgi:hypothetical protein